MINFLILNIVLYRKQQYCFQVEGWVLFFFPPLKVTLSQALNVSAPKLQREKCSVANLLPSLELCPRQDDEACLEPNILQMSQLVTGS